MSQSTREVPRWVNSRISEALSDRVDVESAQARARAARVDVEGVSRWSDPKLTYRYAPRPIETKRGETPHALGVTQRLPAWGEVERARRAQDALAVVEEVGIEALKERIKLEVWRALWRVWRAERMIVRVHAITAWRVKRAHDLEGQVSVGERPLSDLIHASQRVALMKSRVRSLKGELARARVSLGDALGRGVVSDLKLPDLSSLVTLCVDAEAPSNADVQRLLSDPPKRPSLERAAREVNAAEEHRALVITRQQPRVEIGAQWVIVSDPSGTRAAMGAEGDDALIAQVGVSLPLWRDADLAVQAAATARVEAQRYDERRQRERWRAQVLSAARSARELSARILMYQRDLIPRQTQLIETIGGEVSTSMTSLARLYEASEQLEELRLTQDTLIAEYGDVSATWRWLTGEPLTHDQGESERREPERSQHE